MPRISLLGGAYASRSLIASAQQCINLYPEATPEETTPPTPVVHLLTPGLVNFLQPGGGAGAVRAIYRTTNGLRIAVVGTAVYCINVFNNTVQTLSIPIAAGTTPVSILDNGIVCVITTGAAGVGYWFSVASSLGGLASTTLAPITDAAFYGGAVVFLDGWFAFNRPGTNQFYLSPPYWNGTDPFDGTQIASKTGGPDQIIGIATVNGNLWLLGTDTSEVWYDSGATDFPFERQPGVLIQHGLGAATSIRFTDVELLFIGRDTQGSAVVFKSEGYGLKKVSTFALDNLLSKSTYTDAIGMIYQQEGHTFYMLAFPTLNQTWVYDLATGQWHQRTWFGGGVETRHRANCCAFWDDGIYVGDYGNGWIYKFDLNTYTDPGVPILRTRGLPHIVSDGKRLSHSSLIVDMDVSQVAAGSVVNVVWSDDRGATYGTAIALSILSTFTSLLLRRLGLARDRVYVLYWSFAYPTSLQGVWLEAEKAET